MRKLLLASVASSVLVSAAMAADVSMPVTPPPLPQFTWTGLYIGGNAGWTSLQDNGLPFCLTPSGVMQGPGCDIVPGGQVGASGFIGGGQVGYNWQAGRLVLGIEADLQSTSLKGTTRVAGPFQFVGGGLSGPGTSFVASENLPWLGTLRGRFGVAFDRLLIYLTGGLSMGGLDVTQAHIFPGLQYASNASRTLNGYTFGGGMEWAFFGNWSIKAEGMYYDLGTLGTQSVAIPAVAPSFIDGKNFDGRGVIARAGVNFRFGEPFTLAAAPSY
jgi:outer membrane immunogenic protein